MGKPGFIAIIAFGCAVVADQYWYYGYYTDGALGALQQIRHSFGW
jgi:hypothetical protein